MPVIEGLDPNLQWLLTTVFVVAVAVFTAWSHVKGKATPRQKSTEFSMAGQLADMGPVKELVEQTGLLVQQQVRTNMHLEAVAKSMEGLAGLYEAHLEALATQEEVEERAQQLFERRLAEHRPTRRRRSAPAKKPASS